MNTGWHGYLAVAGLAVITLLSRGFFLLPRKAVPIPAALRRALQVAPIAALAAVVVPEIVMVHGQWPTAWLDARWPAVVAATLAYAWRPGVLGPLLVGLLLYLPLRLVLGW